ncbi:DUF6089 family protein [Flavisolibacter tropicus]|uniref:DUF6089 family protein n=1 Tax=Flavisolibacter tropicus TaxID=1492898 RepID=UPI00082D3986|nr:DUF6089 family protein [Flavisolibacter tropicus]
MKYITVLFLSFISHQLIAQDVDKGWHVGLLGGLVNYQGDLQPNSFSFERSQFLSQAWIRKNLNNRIAVKTGIGIGLITAADKYNRDYLQVRNLSFQTNIKEAFLNLELAILDIQRSRWTPYGYGGIAAFHFDPYAYDQTGNKIYLKPLSTEGQGISDFPDRKPYKLTQMALGFGGGVHFLVGEGLTVSLETGQRKTFTDYLDDVSDSYVDKDKLLAARGTKAVELAFRGDELNSNIPYPAHGEQRGTPKEMDWYYYIGLSVEVNLSKTNYLLSSIFNGRKENNYTRCPSVF